MSETENGNIQSICLVKGIVLNRTVLCFPICSCFRIHKIPLILCLIALKIHVKFEGKQTCGLKNDMSNWYLRTNRAKTEWWLPVYLPQKLVNFFLAGAGVRVKNLNFLGLIFGKVKLVERKRVMKGLGKLNRAFPFLPSPKISEFLSSGPEGGIFKP